MRRFVLFSLEVEVRFVDFVSMATDNGSVVNDKERLLASNHELRSLIVDHVYKTKHNRWECECQQTKTLFKLKKELL